MRPATIATSAGKASCGRASGQHRHELQQGAGHGEAEPADGDQMHEDQRPRLAPSGGGIAKAGRSQPLGHQQEGERGGKIAHGPA